jgi:protein-L-isoaspartate(D-aspartate) O-methyltransferase
MRLQTAIIPLIIIALATTALAKDKYAERRQALIDEIESDVRATAEMIGKSKLDERVLKAMDEVPREDFVPKALRIFAYDNRPLPIGYGQTISQPYIVAIMTDLLGPKPGDKVLEVGTGSGYQAAILSKLVGEVYTIEIIPELAKEAAGRLNSLGYANVKTKAGDGYFGWKDAAPFDGIIVTAAASQIPPPLVKQLKPGGRMIIPVGSPFYTQQLVLVTKDVKGKITMKQLLPVRFVPLTGKH